MGPILINKHVFESCYNDLKFMVWNQLCLYQSNISLVFYIIKQFKRRECQLKNDSVPWETEF